MRTIALWTLVTISCCTAAVAAARTDAPDVPDFPPSLDLHFDPSQLSGQTAPLGPNVLEAERADHYSTVAPSGSDRGLSFGVEVTRGVSTNRLGVRQPAESGLRDDLEQLIDHSTLGLRGSYRF